MRKLRYVFIAITGSLLYTILLGALVRNIYLTSNTSERWPWLTTPVKFMAEIPSLLKRSLEAPEFMVKNSYTQDGISTGKKELKDYPKILVSYKNEKFGQKFELLDLNHNKSLQKWEPDNSSLFEKAYNKLNPRKPPQGSDLYFMHPYLLNDESLIFNSQLTSLLVRIDKSNNIIWLNNDRTYHHTIEMDDEGNLFVCTQPFKSAKYDIMPSENESYRDILMDDEITKLDPATGKILWSKPVMEILIQNGYESLISQKGQIISDPIHLNDIQPALTSTSHWNKGDLLVSCRNISTIFLYRPSTNKILWLKQGPWNNQHDVDFHKTNEIVVFGNDIIREESTIDPKLIDKNLFFNRKSTHNEVYIYNFEADSVETPFSSFLKNEQVKTITSGRCDILENGDLFVEDTNNGRILFGDSTDLKLEYVKRIDAEHISTLFWSRLIK